MNRHLVLASILMASFVFACGSKDQPPSENTSDAGTQADAGEEPDAGEQPDAGESADAGEQPDGGDQQSSMTECVSNAECVNPAERCESVEDELFGRCMLGERGTGALGASCSQPHDCASAVCINDEFCSQPCESDDDCAAPLARCNGFLQMCVPE